MRHLSDRGRALAAMTAAVAALALGACAPKMQKEGNAIEPPLLSQIEPGVNTKTQVQNLVGSPSSIPPFDQNTWYYISKRTEQWAFLDPIVMDEQVIQIKFDDKGVVESVRKFGEDDTHGVDRVARTTPSRGKSITVIEEVYNTLIYQFTGGAGVPNARDPFNH
jgi:outer membrane protein assembly factor BamE (lipoprotein component of BamABCDE complex)